MNHTAENWRLLQHVYSGWVSFSKNVGLGNGGRKGKLHPRHFAALKLAAENKPLGRRDRRDDSLLRAIGNWLYSDELGAWRNPNRSHKYRKGNKEIWQEFITDTPDYSLTKSRQ